MTRRVAVGIAIGLCWLTFAWLTHLRATYEGMSSLHGPAPYPLVGLLRVLIPAALVATALFTILAQPGLGRALGALGLAASVGVFRVMLMLEPPHENNTAAALFSAGMITIAFGAVVVAVAGSARGRRRAAT